MTTPRHLITTAIKELWNSMDRVPDCPTCGGTGEPVGLSDLIWWKGLKVRVCAYCQGSGKV